MKQGLVPPFSFLQISLIRTMKQSNILEHDDSERKKNDDDANENDSGAKQIGCGKKVCHPRHSNVIILDKEMTKKS